MPDKLDASVQRIVHPIKDRAIQDIHDLLGRIGRLEALDHNVTIYPDAEEYISRRLVLNRIPSVVSDMRRNPREHPRRASLLKAGLLAYRMDGIAFAVGAERAILADDIGGGKTVHGIGVTVLPAREADIEKVLMVCSASMKARWPREAERCATRDGHLLGSTVDTVA